MKPQEAIAAMKFYKAKLYNGIINQYISAFDVAISALEKQIPKKPTECGEDWFTCPQCKTNIITLDELETHKYCLNCGQALDWSDTE